MQGFAGQGITMAVFTGREQLKTTSANIIDGLLNPCFILIA
ncbi:hypothetical protein X474_12870 [Dethiosulfatarculus sandiegensis]|uniref:Uncharacterized protein n=1 Tax=Dethiosulfatarculus sandiegensis TaxID=1429043 RepID=A0A0D2J734_9BACT|nr:hypothetical protein X474_12870 [Dethiosulfatarculus sandiegensis]